MTGHEMGHAYALAAGATLCWGVVVVFIKLADIPGRLGVGISLAAGCCAMFAVAGRDLARVADLTLPQIALFVMTGTVQFTAGCMLYYDCIRRGSMSVVVPITRAKVVLILFLSILLGLETFRWLLLAAALLVVLGGVLVGAPDQRAVAAERKGHRDSIILAGVACLCWTFGETFIGKLPKDIPAATTNAILLGCGFASYTVYATVSGVWRELLTVPWRGVWCYAAHGLISFAAAYVMFVRAIQIAGPARITVITSLYPLISAIIGWSLFKERCRPTVAAGALLLVAGVVLLRLV